MASIPQSVRSLIWWAKVDERKDKRRIVTSVLNYGGKKAICWANKKYGKKEIKNCIKDPLPGEWDEKSLNFAQLLYGVHLSSSAKEKAKRNLNKIQIGRKGIT